MFCVGLVLGFFILLVIFFILLGNLKIFYDDGVFWVIFFCIVIFILVVFMGCLRILNILICGVIGFYLVVLVVGSYLFISFFYIILNVFKRVFNKDFYRIFINVFF